MTVFKAVTSLYLSVFKQFAYEPRCVALIRGLSLIPLIFIDLFVYISFILFKLSLVLCKIDIVRSYIVCRSILLCPLMWPYPYMEIFF